MHYLQNFKSQRMLPEEEARERGAEREEMEDIQMVNKARRALANSYVFGYYGFVKESPFASRLSLFEDKQQILEREVSKSIHIRRQWQKIAVKADDLWYDCLCTICSLLDQVEIFARMLQDMHIAKADKRPSVVDIK